MKRELKFFGLSYSQSQIGSYVAVLDEVRGTRKMVVVVRPGEAQVISAKIEKVKPRRPMTHEVLKSLTDSFNMDVQEVIIYNQAEGIFYTKLVCSDGVDEHFVECSVGDGIAFSLVYGCPLYIEEEILSAVGIEVDSSGNVVDIYEDDVEDDIDDDLKDFIEEELVPKKPTVTIPQLEKKMQEALANEEYEEAAKLRDKIQKLKENGTDNKL